MTYLLDTITLIYFFRGTGKVAESLLSVPPTEVVVPSIVVYELEVGIAKSDAPGRRAKQLATSLRAIRTAPFDDEAARAAARTRATLESDGRPIGPVDTLIAGQALSLGAILVTRNRREFERVPGLQVVDWYGPS